MGNNHSSVVVLRIGPKFWWMLPMGLRDSRAKYAPETQRGRSETGVASARPPFQNMQFSAKMCPFTPKTAREPAENGQMKGNSGYSTQFGGVYPQIAPPRPAAPTNEPSRTPLPSPPPPSKSHPPRTPPPQSPLPEPPPQHPPPRGPPANG